MPRPSLVDTTQGLRFSHRRLRVLRGILECLLLPDSQPDPSPSLFGTTIQLYPTNNRILQLRSRRWSNIRTDHGGASQRLDEHACDKAQRRDS